MTEIKLGLQAAQDGMKLSRAIHDKDGKVIVPEETCLNSNIISYLKNVDTQYIWVDLIVDDEDSVYMNSIKERDEFKKFCTAHSQVTDKIKNLLDKIVFSNLKINEEELITHMSPLLKITDNPILMLEFLHCMRIHDDSTYDHSVNVGLICNIIGKWLNFNKEDRKILTLCGLLHDIGKLKIPKEVLNKPGKLTDEEFEIIKKHPEYGHQIIKTQNINIHIKNSILQHHEKCDGKGYPYGKDNIEIDEYAKIVTIADIFDAMTANRIYRKGLSPIAVIDWFQSEPINKYKAEYLKIFLEQVADTYLNKHVLLSNDEEAHVVLINKSNLTKPIVKTKTRLINLAEEDGLSIKELL